jgi:hypothetical protein
MKIAFAKLASTFCSQPFRVAAVLVAASLGLQCVAAQAEIIHRYSFDDGKADDSVGKVHGRLMGNAKIVDGALKLDNLMKTSDDDGLQYLSFAERVLPKTGSATIEVWFTSKSDGGYSRLFDFGQRGQGYIFMTVDEGEGGVARAAITENDNGEEATLRSQGRVNDGKPHMAAVVIDNDYKLIRLYIDGKQQGNGEPLGENTIEKVRGMVHWVGRSIFESDAGLTGTIDELRIFDSALKPDEIAAHYTAGAKTIPGADAKKGEGEKK